MGAVHAPYNLEMAEACTTCRLKNQSYFCNLPSRELEMLASVSYPTVYPEGAVLFVEGQMPRGVYVLCRGRAKLSMVSSEGKTLILRIAEPGDLLGVSACLLDRPYQATVETLSPCQLNFIRREDFLRYMRGNGEAMFRVAQFLSREYQSACNEIGSLGLSHSAAEKMARLLLGWKEVHSNGGGSTLKLTLTHEEMAQMIGASRETVTRMLARFRERKYIEVQGATLTIRNRGALEAIAQNDGATTAEPLAAIAVQNAAGPASKRAAGPGNGGTASARARSARPAVAVLPAAR